MAYLSQLWDFWVYVCYMRRRYRLGVTWGGGLEGLINGFIKPTIGL